MPIVSALTTPPTSIETNLSTLFLRYFTTSDENTFIQGLKNAGIEAVCFDMDGTLVDTEGANLKIVEEGLRVHDVELTNSERELFIGTTIKGFSEKILAARGIPEPEIKAEVIGTSKETKFIEWLSRNEIKGFNRIINLVRVLKKHNFKIALTTSSQLPIAKMILNHFGIFNLFDVLKTREDCDNKLKPNPFIYEEAIKTLNSSPNNTLALEDSAPGIKSAYGAGMKVIAIRNLHEQNPKDIPKDRVFTLDLTTI